MDINWTIVEIGAIFLAGGVGGRSWIIALIGIVIIRGGI